MFRFLIIYILLLDGGKAQRLWKNEEWNRTLELTKKDLESKHVSLSIHTNLSSISIRSRNLEIFRKDFPAPRDPTLVSMGFHGSVMVVVIKIGSVLEVMVTKEFFSGQPTEGHILLSFLRSLQPNRLVLLIGRPNFLGFLSKEEEQYLAELGSAFISILAEKDSWIMAIVTTDLNETERHEHAHSSFREESDPFNLYKNNSQIKVVKDYLTDIEAMLIGRMGPKYSTHVLGETKLKSTESLKEFGSSVMEFFVPIFYDMPKCHLYTSPEYSLQAQFCRRHEGYGRLCSCHETYIPGKKIGPIPIAMKEKIPIVIVTANKPQTLFRLLMNLDVVRGSGQTEKLIIVDGFVEETLALGKLFGLDVRVHKPQGNSGDNTRTNMNIGFALWAAFDHFKGADKVILLEDDLLLSPDMLSFFHSLSILLDVGERISHVSAFGQNSFPRTAGDLGVVLRAEMYPQYGWMTTRTWTQLAFRNWVREGKNIDWDWWLFNEGPKLGYDAIVPEVSRTGHVGSSGAHVTGYDQLRKFHFRVISTSGPSEKETFVLDRLVSSQRYDSWMEDQIMKAQKIRLDVHPCIEDIFPPNKTGPFVLYLGAVSREDTHESFYLMQACLGTDATDVKEIFNGVLRLNVASYFDIEKALQGPHLVRRKILYLVGCPLSKYCKFSERFKDWPVPSENILEIAEDISAKRRNKYTSHILRFRKRKLIQKTKDHIIPGYQLHKANAFANTQML